MFIDQIEKICKEKKITPSKMCDSLGISRATLSKWRSGAIPNRQNLKRISDYLMVSEQCLLFGDDDTADVEILPTKVITTTAESEELMRIYNTLDIKKRAQLILYAYELLEK